MLSVKHCLYSKIFTEPLAAESHVFSRFARALGLTRSMSGDTQSGDRVFDVAVPPDILVRLLVVPPMNATRPLAM